jgi:hypothetical protein
MGDAGWEYRRVGIDFEVHKALTALLQSPADTENDVLRRLLALPAEVRSASTGASSGALPWVVEGVQFPHGTEFRAKYKGQLHTGRVDDGVLLLNGERFGSPSAAAISVTGNSVNGWRFWECRRPSEVEWSPIDRLRT